MVVLLVLCMSTLVRLHYIEISLTVVCTNYIKYEKK